MSGAASAESHPWRGGPARAPARPPAGLPAGDRLRGPPRPGWSPRRCVRRRRTRSALDRFGRRARGHGQRFRSHVAPSTTTGRSARRWGDLLRLPRAPPALQPRPRCAPPPGVAGRTRSRARSSPAACWRDAVARGGRDLGLRSCEHDGVGPDAAQGPPCPASSPTAPPRSRERTIGPGDASLRPLPRLPPRSWLGHRDRPWNGRRQRVVTRIRHGPAGTSDASTNHQSTRSSSPSSSAKPRQPFNAGLTSIPAPL